MQELRLAETNEVAGGVVFFIVGFAAGVAVGVAIGRMLEQ